MNTTRYILFLSADNAFYKDRFENTSNISLTSDIEVAKFWTTYKGAEKIASLSIMADKLPQIMTLKVETVFTPIGLSEVILKGQFQIKKENKKREKLLTKLEKLKVELEADWEKNGDVAQ